MKKYIEMLLKVEPKYPIVLRFIDGTELTFDSIFDDIISDKDNDPFIELKLKDEDESYIINTNHVIYAVSNRDFD